MRKPVFFAYAKSKVQISCAVTVFPTRSHTNQAVQPQKMAGSLKFRILEVEGLLYPCGENKDADQLRGYRESDLRLCFRICKNLVFSHDAAHTILSWLSKLSW